MRKPLTLGSLFDGSGGFLLGATLSNVQPLWKSEIEPFAVAVTNKRFPYVKHFGDISTLSGEKLLPVDIITFGSPCTDLSIAGKRAGLDGSKSSLFYEAIRIVKEMREKTNGEKPRFIVWENVCGAFSANKGEDFRCVLENICQIKDESLPIPQSTKWTNAGHIMGENFSLAWRVLDAQYWGVPQRRKRIYLVADFGGECASKILFESEGSSGYSHESFQAWQKATDTPRNSSQATSDYCLNDQGGERMDVCKDTTSTLRASSNHPPLVFENHSQDLRFKGPIETAQTVVATYGTGGNNQPFVVENAKTYDVRFTSEGTRNSRANVYESDTSRTIDTSGNPPERNQGGLAIVYSASKNSHFTKATEELAGTLVATDYKDPPLVNERYIVRRLTPKECARLQGFPSWWCSDLSIEKPTKEDVTFWREVFECYRLAVKPNVKPKTDKQIVKWLKHPHSDSAEYRLWGNGVALPNVVFVLSGIAWTVENCNKLPT